MAWRSLGLCRILYAAEYSIARGEIRFLPGRPQFFILNPLDTVTVAEYILIISRITPAIPRDSSTRRIMEIGIVVVDLENAAAGATSRSGLGSG
jgi:hypothetical protein